MVMSFLYWMFRRLLELVIAGRRSDADNEIELLVLRRLQGLYASVLDSGAPAGRCSICTWSSPRRSARPCAGA